MASDKTPVVSSRESIKIADSVKDMRLGEPQYIGTYRKVVESVGKDEALRLYAGMSPEKSDFICSCGEKLDFLSVRWTLDILKENMRMADSCRESGSKIRILSRVARRR